MPRAAIGLAVLLATPLFAATQGGPLGVTQPLFPPNNWWNTDISAAPTDPNSTAFLQFVGLTRGLHPDFGGDAGGGDVYGFPVIVVGGTQPKKAATFVWPDQSDGVDHTTQQPFPFYPIPDEAITLTGWVEGGQPGNVDQRSAGDRHILIVDQTNNRLYELYNVWFNGTNWEAGSGAHYYMNRNDRRPDTWTSADAAGLAILPGLVRYEEVYGPYEIGHALRMTVRTTNGYVYPASHNAGSTAGALPMGARLRLKRNQGHLFLPRGRSEDFPGVQEVRPDRRRQRHGHVHQRDLRHALEQRRPQPCLFGADGERLRGDPTRLGANRGSGRGYPSIDGRRPGRRHQRDRVRRQRQRRHRLPRHDPVHLHRRSGHASGALHLHGGRRGHASIPSLGDDANARSSARHRDRHRHSHHYRLTPDERDLHSLGGGDDDALGLFSIHDQECRRRGGPGQKLRRNPRLHRLRGLSVRGHRAMDLRIVRPEPRAALHGRALSARHDSGAERAPGHGHGWDAPPGATAIRYHQFGGAEVPPRPLSMDSIAWLGQIAGRPV